MAEDQECSADQDSCPWSKSSGMGDASANMTKIPGENGMKEASSEGKMLTTCFGLCQKPTCSGVQIRCCAKSCKLVLNAYVPDLVCLSCLLELLACVNGCVRKTQEGEAATDGSKDRNPIIPQNYVSKSYKFWLINTFLKLKFHLIFCTGLNYPAI